MARRSMWLVGAVLAALVPAAPARAETATLTVTPSSAAIVYGDEVAFDAVVAGPAGTPTGTVRFAVGDQAPVDVELVDGAATFVPEFLLGVDEPVTAAYSGDDVYDPVPAIDVAPVVGLAPTSTALTVEPSTVAVGGQVQVTVVVSNTATFVTPVGEVAFVVDGVPRSPTACWTWTAGSRSPSPCLRRPGTMSSPPATPTPSHRGRTTSRARTRPPCG